MMQPEDRVYFVCIPAMEERWQALAIPKKKRIQLSLRRRQYWQLAGAGYRGKLSNTVCHVIEKDR